MDADRHSHTTDSQQTRTGSVTLEPHHTSPLDETWMKQAIPPAVPPKQGPLPENDGPQPLAAHYTPHEYVDVNGVRNKALHVTPMTSAGFEKFSQHVQPPPAATKRTWEQRIYGMRRSTFALVVALVVTVAAAIGLGVGLGVGLRQTGGGGSHDGGTTTTDPSACPAAQQSQITTSLSSTLTTATTASSSQPTTTDTSRATVTATTITIQTLPLSTSTPNINAQSHLTCPTSNSTILLSSFSPSSSLSPSSFSPQPQASEPQPLKYQILCDSNLPPFPPGLLPIIKTRLDLAGPLRGVQTTRTMLGHVRRDQFFSGKKRRGGCLELCISMGRIRGSVGVLLVRALRGRGS
ncbi:hypothetical protein B0H65DRAFT_455184 [Neurospora tetraspora]|uniref:Uncharacterized protein n=1 Tax=Neurospora tetraspora TaxID=94610 RepID=A0AAE0JJJ6_9PEZI|nr:hypothetical protein B0H65DRAFT_455184 [Neurospora tetraspora]